jgi:hypothetical protein
MYSYVSFFVLLNVSVSEALSILLRVERRRSKLLEAADYSFISWIDAFSTKSGSLNRMVRLSNFYNRTSTSLSTLLILVGLISF